MGRLAAALGAEPRTLMGLAGLGDLTLTCSAMQSRNFSLGVALGQGRNLDAILGERRSVAEGVWTASRSEEHTSELQSLMRISYAVFCLKKKKHNTNTEYKRQQVSIPLS